MEKHLGIHRITSLFTLPKILGIMLGAAAGYGYYYFVGCSSGHCPITSNPWISTAYGAVFGYLIAPTRRNPETPPVENIPQG